jgi:2-aminoadipate transaminase
MFFWVELPPLLDSMALLSKAVDAGIAFVPGAAFYCTEPRANTMRLSFVTVSPERIAEGVEKLGVVIAAALAEEEKASGVATEEGKAA